MQVVSIAALRLNGEEPYDFSQFGEGGLAELRQSVDDAKPQVISQLDLHHLG